MRKILSQDPAAVATRADDGETPLMAALYRGHSQAVTFLLESGAPLDLFAAAATGGVEYIEREIAARPGAVNDYAYDGWTALHLAAFFGRHTAAERLLDAGADPCAVSRNSLSNTPLHAALAGSHTEVALAPDLARRRCQRHGRGPPHAAAYRRRERTHRCGKGAPRLGCRRARG